MAERTEKLLKISVCLYISDKSCTDQSHSYYSGRANERIPRFQKLFKRFLSKNFL